MNEEFQIMLNFFKDAVHLREAGAALALCGVPAGGWFIHKFMSISQMGGSAGCKECVRKAGEKKMERRK